MSDDSEVCGAETADGSPCQHSAGEDGRCWLESHTTPGAENSVGRPSKLDESDHETILDAARKGASVNGCARAAGVSWQSLDRYLDAHEDFRRTFAQARAEGEQEILDGGMRDPDVDSSFAKFLLASSFDYKKTEQTEVTGEGGGSIIINTTSNDE